MSDLKNYYTILEVPENASAFDIEKAYQRLSSSWHPDRHRENRRAAQIKFNDISEAYETLSNKNRRAHYDELLTRQYSLEDANRNFEKFYEQFGIEDEREKQFFEKNYPQRKRNFYDVLEVPRNASFDEIKRAYRRLALQYHPKNNQGSEEANRRFIEINQAFNSLSNQTNRQNYDDLIFNRKIAPVRAHDIFENFWESRVHDMPNEDQFFKPILKKKWSNTLDRLMDSQDNWRDIKSGETVKTSTVTSVQNGVETKKNITTRRVIENGIPVTTTTEEYVFPNGTKEVRKIRDDGKGNVTTDVYNLKRGQNLPIGF